MRFGILGPLEVRSGTGKAVTVSGPRPRALLVLLALHAGHPVSVEQLIAGQYGAEAPEGAANALQAQVSRLRRSLGGARIEFGPGGYRLAADPEDVDAHHFAALARQGRRQLAAGRPAEAAAVFRQGLELWRGQALADLPHAHSHAAGLEEQRLAVTEDLFEAQLALPGGPSLDELAAATTAHPRRERLAGQYLRALHAAGRRAEALAHYDRLRHHLAEELGIDPSPELAQIHLAILRADRAAPPSRQGLAAQLTSFVGRDAELARLDELRQARLVTISGPGGTGKTRLAIESARRRDDPLCFVDLSGIEGGEQVPHAVLTATGLRDPAFRLEAAADPTTRLVDALRDQRLLLVIDNCEHVIASAAALVRTLLAECPGLSVMATSREPLGLTGEALVPLATLEAPDPNTPPAEALAHPAIRLFADRAAAVRPGFTIAAADTETVIDVCAALDGLPLAIELAAARLRQFTLAQLADRLAAHGPFRLLSRGDRTAAARHRTLRAAVEWSWDLLRPQERELARRFAVFSHGAAADAVEAVAGAVDTEDLLADLVDKSFVTVDGGRYRMLDSIRLLCLEYLDEAGERETMRRKHARYYLDLAEQADPHLRRAEQLDWLAALSADHGNLMAALRWAADHDRATGFRLIAAMSAYLWFSGRSSQVGPIAARLLTDVPEGVEEEYVSCVVHAIPRAAAHHWERAGKTMLQIATRLRYPFGAALWGMAVGPWAPPQEYEPGLGADEWNRALGRLSVGLVMALNGRPGKGEAELEAVLAGFEDLGERWGTGQALDWLAEAAGWRGEWRRAHDLRSRALAQFSELGALEEAADVLARRAGCLVRQGDYESASSDYQRSAQLAAQAGRPGVPAAVSLGLGEIAAARGDLTEARRLFDDALATAEGGDFGTEAFKTRAMTALARLAERSDDTAQARRWHRGALEATRPLTLASDLAEAAQGQAGAALLDGEADRAALLLGAAVALRGTTVAGQTEVARTAADASGRLGAAGFAQIYAVGVKLTREQALAKLYDRHSDNP